MKNKTNILAIVIQIVICLSTVLYIGNSKAKAKTGFINLGKIFNEFELSKEYNLKVTNYQNKTKLILDSMEIEINALAKTISKKSTSSMIALFEKKKELYFIKKEEFEQSYENQTNNYTEQAMKQMNQYIRDFGKDNNFTYIYGAEGSGALMYGDEGEDITADVLNYINKKYVGKK
jgi:outer membrane protein